MRFRKLFNYLKIKTYDNYYVHGSEKRLKFVDKDSCGFANTLFNTSSGNITVGRNVVFGHNVMILTGYHDYRNNINYVPKDGFDIVIGSNCWICSGVIVCGGVNIADNSVLKAGTVVYKNNKLKI